MKIPKTIRNDAILVGVACLLAIITFSASSVTASRGKGSVLTTTWVYVGPDLPNVINFTSSNYVQNPGTLPPTCNLGTDLPCQFIVPDSVNTLTKLQTHLISHYGSDAEDLRDNASTKKGI